MSADEVVKIDLFAVKNGRKIECHGALSWGIPGIHSVMIMRLRAGPLDLMDWRECILQFKWKYDGVQCTGSGWVGWFVGRSVGRGLKRFRGDNIMKSGAGGHSITLHWSKCKE